MQGMQARVWGRKKETKTRKWKDEARESIVFIFGFCLPWSSFLFFFWGQLIVN